MTYVTLPENKIYFVKAFFAALFFIFATPQYIAGAQNIEWMSTESGKLVHMTSGYEKKTLTSQYWQGFVSNPIDPIIELESLQIDADKHTFLYLDMAVDYADSVQLFFGPDEYFNQEHSFRVYEITIGLKRQVYKFDLSSFKSWRGPVRHLRIDVEGAAKGDTIRLYGVGFSENSVGLDEAVNVTISTKQKKKPVKSERMAVHHHTLVVAHEKRPNTAVMTYGLDKPASTAQYVLCKFVPEVVIGAEPSKKANAVNLKVQDTPGSVVGTYMIKDVKVTYEVMPLLVGRDTETQDGAALYRIKTEPPISLVVRCGGGQVHNPF